MYQRQWMDFDKCIDNKFHARQAHTVARQKGRSKRLLWIGQIQQDTGARAPDLTDPRPRRFKGQRPIINKTRITFRTAHRDHLAVPQRSSAMPRAHHRGHAQLATDNGRMTSPPPTVGDNGRRLLHDRLPVRIRLVRHQHFALRKIAHAARLLNDPHPPRRNFFAHRPPRGQYQTALTQPPRFQDLTITL